MRHLNRLDDRRGFTLIELMIVIAILSILSALAMPRFIDIRYRAQRSELPSIVDSLYTAQVAHHVSTDRYIEVSTYTPRAITALDRQQANWPTTSNFYLLDWRPDGPVRGTYRIESDLTSTFTITGLADLDSDTNRAEFVATQDVTVARISPITTF